MNRTGVVLVLMTAFAAHAAVATAGQKAVTVSSGWVKAPAPGESTAAAFAVIENPGMYDFYIVSATAEGAGRVQFRDASKPGDLKAQTVEFMIVPAYGSFAMKPDGVHLVLMDLKKPLKPGDTLSLTLTTDGDATLTVAAVVKD